MLRNDDTAIEGAKYLMANAKVIREVIDAAKDIVSGITSGFVEVNDRSYISIDAIRASRLADALAALDKIQILSESPATLP